MELALCCVICILQALLWNGQEFSVAERSRRGRAQPSTTAKPKPKPTPTTAAPKRRRGNQ